MWEWIKKFKLWFLGLFIATALAAPIIEEINIPANYELLIDKDEIIYYKTQTDKNDNIFIRYYYQIEDPADYNEIIAMRTESGKTYDLGNGQLHLTKKLGFHYEKKDGKWLELKSGTTTPEYFDRQISRIIKRTLAAENEQVGASTDDASQNGAGDNANLTLTEDYVGDFSGTGTWTSGSRFTTINIAKGSTIDTATISFKASWAGDAAVETLIYGDDIDDSVTFSQAEGPTDRMAAKTTANITWDPGAWIGDAFNASPDISTIIQEIIDRAGWSANNDLSILVTDDSGGSWESKEYYTFDNAAGDAPKLDITYTAGSSDTCTYGGSGNWRIDSDDNCYITANTYVYGNIDLYDTGTGSLFINNNAILTVQGINSTSTDIQVEAGSTIKFY